MGPTVINNETGETVAEDRSNRFIQWIAFFVFSIIVLGSAVQVVRGGVPSVPQHCWWENK